VRQAKRIFADAGFGRIRVDRRNISVPRIPQARLWAMRLGVDRPLGLDLYLQVSA
jgi:hypothetical protein